MKGTTLFFMLLALSVRSAAADPDSVAMASDQPREVLSEIEIQEPIVRLPAPAGSRGQMLYENHCLGCHESVLFIRERRTVGSFVGLRAAVLRWAAETKLPWGTEELDDVIRYLNGAYYRFEAR